MTFALAVFPDFGEVLRFLAGNAGLVFTWHHLNDATNFFHEITQYGSNVLFISPDGQTVTLSAV